MNADFLAVLEFWEREKGINRDVLIALSRRRCLSAAKKAVGPARELRVAIDQKNGDIRAFAKLIVSEKVISKHDQISVFDARRIKPMPRWARRSKWRSPPSASAASPPNTPSRP